VLFLIDDRLPAEPPRNSGWLADVPWRGVAAVAFALALSIVGSGLPPLAGLACVIVAAIIAIRVVARLGDWRGLRDHHQ
jgi:hypothetical protein